MPRLIAVINFEELIILRENLEMRLIFVTILISFFSSSVSHSQVMSYKPFREDYNISIFDVYKSDLNGDQYSDFVVLYGDRDQQKPAPLRCLISNKEEKFFDLSDKCFPGIKTVHARNVIEANLNNNTVQNHLVIADHGPDVAPFTGGVSLVLQKKANSATYLNLTKEFLPGLKKLFTYSIANEDINNDYFEDLYFATYANTAPFFKMMINQKNSTFKEDNSAFPTSNPDFNKCFMSAHFVDLDNDRIKELVLGGCNINETAAFSKTDLILKKNKLGKYEVVKNAFPARHKVDHWGTNAFSFADINKDGLLDIVASIHNFNSTSGEVKIYINHKKLKFSEISAPLKLGSVSPQSFYIQRVVTNDLNKDGFADLFFTLRDNNRRSGKLNNCVFVMLNNGKEGFENVSEQLTIERRCYAAVDTLRNPNVDLLEMIFFDFDGTLSSIRVPELTIPKVVKKSKK